MSYGLSHKKFSLSLLGVSVFFAMQQGAYANEESQQPHVVLEREVVTAEAQVKQSLGVSKISESDLEQTPVVSDISEIVRKMPGVNLTGNSATGQRGNNRQIDIRGMGPENTLILVDGKPVTSRNSVRYGWRGERDTRGDSQWVPSNAIQSIEVIRGPAAARYGSGAMGGVVNIITKKVADKPTGSVTLFANLPENSKEGESKRVSANFSAPLIKDTLGMRIYGNFNKTDMDSIDINPLSKYYNANGTSYLARAAGREGVENKDLGMLLAWKINPNHTLSLDMTYGRQGNEYSGDTQYSNRDATNATASAQSASNLILNSLIGTETNIMRRDSFSLTHDGEYDWGNSKFVIQRDSTKNTRLDEGLAGGPEGVIRTVGTSAPKFEDTKLRTLRVHGETNIPLNFMLPQQLTIGAEYVKDVLNDNANMDEGTSTGTDPNATYANALYQGDRSKMTSTIKSAYVEDNLQVGNNTNLVLGLRYDHHNKSGGNFSPAINLTHHLNNNWTLKAGVARAYKAPNLYQNSEGYLLGTRGQGCPWQYGTSIGWCVLQGNEDLKPETSLNTELGFQYKDNITNASLTYFHSNYKDKIAASDTIKQVINTTYGTGTSNYNILDWVNIPRAKVEGVEGSIGFDWGKWRWTNNITYMIESVDKRTGNPLSMIPEYTLNSTIGYTINDKWDANLLYTHYGRQKPRQFAESNIENRTKDGLLHNTEVKSYGILSINTGYKFNDHINARFGINNLFDEAKLRDNSVSQTYNEPGRAYYASLEYQF